MTLEEQLVDLCKLHSLCHVSLNVTRHGDDWMIYVNAQREVEGKRFCGSSGYDADRFVIALPEALVSLCQKVTPDTLPPLEDLAA